MGLKWLLALIFVVHVEIPLGVKATYYATNLKVHESCYELILTNGNRIFVPTTFTIVEEKDD